MKTATLSLIFALSMSNFAFAQSGPAKKVDPTMTTHGCDMKGMDMKGMDMKGMTPEQCREMMKGRANSPATSQAATTTTHKAVAVVKNVDKNTGKVTLAHGPVKSLNWPAMSMGFSVKDKQILDKLIVGRKVNVEFVKQGSEYVVTAAK